MKKSLIWLLTIVMSLTFGALLYFQIMYLENMVKMRDAQFSETVMRCLSSTSSMLERKETMHFPEEDVNIIESNLYDDTSYGSNGENFKYTIESPDGIRHQVYSRSRDRPFRTRPFKGIVSIADRQHRKPLQEHAGGYQKSVSLSERPFERGNTFNPSRIGQPT